jgi:hypothetical protein
METTATRIKALLNNKTNGLLNIDDATAEEIIQLAKKDNVGEAKKWHFSALKNDWEFIRSIRVCDEEIKKQIETNARKQCGDAYFKYECYASSGALESILYTIDGSLFD